MADLASLPPGRLMAIPHNAFRFSLASAPALVHSARGDVIRRDLVAEYYVNSLLLLETHHDGEEEVYFPLLVERFPTERKKVELGAKQHHEVLSFLAAASVAVEEWQAHGDAETGNVVSALEALDAELSDHLHYEETTIVPLEDGLSPEDRRDYMARTTEHHLAKIPNMAGVLLSISHCRSLLWEAVGEASFRAMIAKVAVTE
jgi:iron-sulfur cluster repair protein YtfE (RIC family)